ncbi:MAG TPA: iron ABC transporter permease, partial [Firmicutes bacterium]|nr:iron ABC transporter permease [Bacillota bacterium]
GAGSGRTFYHVVLPLLKYAFTTTLVYTFIKSINTLSAVIFVVSPGKNVAASSILGLSEHGYWGQASALSAGLILITFAALGLFRLLAGSNAKLFDV